MVSSSFYYAKFFPMSPIWVCLCLIMPGGLPSMGSHRVGHDWHDLAAVAAEAWPQKKDENSLIQIVKVA